jgi:hypothetical protein
MSCLGLYYDWFSKEYAISSINSVRIIFNRSPASHMRTIRLPCFFLPVSMKLVRGVKHVSSFYTLLNIRTPQAGATSSHREPEFSENLE